METTNNQPPPTTTEQTPSFTGELSIEFKKEDLASGKVESSFVTFTPKALLRGEDKWSYPFPTIAQSEDSQMADYLAHFGEDFVKDLFEDSLVKHCQNRWRLSTNDNGTEADFKNRFIENFFISRRDTGPTSAKLGILLTKKMVEHKKLKDAHGKDSPEVKESLKELRALKEEMNNLFKKEME